MDFKTLLALAALSATSFAQGPQTADSQRTSMAQPPAVTDDDWIGGALRGGTAPGISVAPVPGYPNLYDLTFASAGSPWTERFLFQVPAVSPAQAAPLLVVFHQFGVSHYDVQAHTDFLAEASARGWYLVAPLGATQINFSSLDSQTNTKTVLDWVMQFFHVDRDRVYGVGFSMGGGNVVNYAARHMDVNSAVFAAVVNHTGGLSQRDTYLSDPGTRWYMEYLFGGTPDEDLFAYQRSSVFDLDPVSKAVLPEADLAVNLVNTPIQTWYAANDPLAYLVAQNEIFADHMQSLGGDHELVVTPDSVHDWSTMDETAVCDFLAQHTLSIPSGGSARVDQNGRYHHMRVTQDAAGAFTAFKWQVHEALNRFSLGFTENLKRMRVLTHAYGLDPEAPLQLVLGTADGAADQIVLTGYDSPPTSVVRDGQAVTSWTWNAARKTLRIVEQDGGYHFWLITP